MNTEIQAYIDRQTIVDKENLRHARKTIYPACSKRWLRKPMKYNRTISHLEKKRTIGKI